MIKQRFGVALLAMTQLVAAAQTGVPTPGTQAPGSDSYYEFGTVVALGKRDVSVQTFDPQRGRTVQRSFSLTRDTRADVVHVGDTVEVIYAPGGMDDTGQWMLRRLVVIAGGVPKAGPAPSATTATARAASPATPSAQLPPAVVPGRKAVGLGKGSSTAATSKNSGSAPALGRNGMPKDTPSTTAAVTLGNPATARVPGVIAVPLGASTETANGRAPRVRDIRQATPGEECNRSDADWPGQPIKLAVLDFRYPTEREEAHDAGTGGGSGTAVADLVYDNLDSAGGFQLMRGDREKLFRMDFAGAARAGRQLGADAVLLGTFNPVQAAVTDPDFPPPLQGYTLRAGVVDTCTGQLLYRLTSIACANAKVVGAEGDPLACPGSVIPTKVAFDPVSNGPAYRRPIEVLLAPLEGKAAGETGGTPLGSVVSMNGQTATLRVKGGVRVGDEVAVHASRLAKNPTTYTLHRYMDEEIGRVKVERVSGASVTGSYVGDVPAVAGDPVLPVQ